MDSWLDMLFLYIRNGAKKAWDLYLCVSACVRIITTVFCITVLFGSYLHYPSIQVHPTETQYSAETCTTSTGSERKERMTKHIHTFFLRVFVDFLKIEVVHPIMFTLKLIFKHYFRHCGGNESFTFLYFKM